MQTPNTMCPSERFAAGLYLDFGSFGFWNFSLTAARAVNPYFKMPIDFSFETTPNFRELTHTGLLLLRRPIVRSLAKVRQLRKGEAVTEVTPSRPAKLFVGAR